MRARVPQGRRRGQKSERARQKEGKSEQVFISACCRPPSFRTRGAAVCSHAETPALLSPPPLLPAQGLPSKPKLQHMRPSSPAPPTHTYTHTHRFAQKLNDAQVRMTQHPVPSESDKTASCIKSGYVYTRSQCRSVSHVANYTD